MTDLADEYRRQRAWRDWPRVLSRLPDLAGRTVLDLGCAIGDQAAELAARGARVIGVDRDAELLRAARARGIEGAEWIEADLGAFADPGREVDGVWCSFVAAYFPDLAPVLRRWTQRLRPGGWVALVEVDDLLGHEPLAAETRELLDAFARDARDAGRYDFRMGRRLAVHAEAAGLAVDSLLSLPDRELAFDGPAEPEVLEAWARRFDRMPALRLFCGAAFEAAREDLLASLAHPDHRSRCRVRCCLAHRAPAEPGR